MASELSDTISLLLTAFFCVELRHVLPTRTPGGPPPATTTLDIFKAVLLTLGLLGGMIFAFETSGSPIPSIALLLCSVMTPSLLKLRSGVFESEALKIVASYSALALVYSLFGPFS